MKLTYRCPTCQKQLVLDREFTLGETKLFSYKCGHVFARTMHRADKSLLDFTSTDGTKHARPYQEDGIEFIINSGFNCIIGDQMRLGKTPQSLLAFKNALKGKSPCLIIVKSANLWQWTREFRTWVTELPLGIYPITSGGAWIPPSFNAYIISMDTFSRPKVQESLKKIQFKLIIVDEAHSFKNTESNRSQALVDFVKFMNTGESDTELKFNCNRCQHEWTEQGKTKYDKRIGHVTLSKYSQCPLCKNHCYVQQQHSESEDKVKIEPCGLILLTGTPILNRAEEYFVPLNLVAPEKFSSLERFRREWLQQDSKGKWNRIKSYYLESFKETIKPYILRREKEDVYTDLPPLQKIFTLIEPDKGSLTEAYNKIIDKVEAKYASKLDPTYWDMADELMELRRICGMMKVMWTSDYLETCALDSSAKYTVGIHHQAVRDVLYMKLGGEKNCLKLSGEDSGERKDWVMRNFETSSQQFLIINMLAGGVGMDFHYCNNVLVLERQWNSATEEQFEFRFYNPDKSIKTAPTNVEYVLAKGTLDEWWYDMVEHKRKIVGETVATHWDLQSDQVSFKELMEKTLSARL